MTTVMDFSTDVSSRHVVIAVRKGWASPCATVRHFHSQPCATVRDPCI